MTDFSHLNALQHRLFNEQERLASAKSDQERELRQVWVRQIEKEIEAEYKFLGIEPVKLDDISLDDLFAEIVCSGNWRK